MPRLGVGLATELPQVGKPNDFELWHLLNKKLDPQRDIQNCHLESAARDLGGTSCSDFAQTMRFPRLLETKDKDFLIETGTELSRDVLAHVLSSAMDEDSLGRLEDAQVEVTSYADTKDWLDKRDVKL